jgi:serine protease inhibitor
MKGEDLYKAIGKADEELLERSEQNKKLRIHKPWWTAVVAAVLVLSVTAGFLLYPRETPLTTTAHAISEAVYPKMASYPDGDSDYTTGDVDKWHESLQKQKQPEGYAKGLDTFFSASIPKFLSSSDFEEENTAYSPVNVYLALGMLAEITEGNSRQQILDLIGADSMDTLRTQASAVWNGQYRNDGATTSILASSLWLNNDIAFIPETIQQVSDIYYASVYQGKMGSEELNELFQDWMNQQTGGLLQEQIKDLTLDEGTVLSLATTIYYRAKWVDTFSEENTSEDTFHAAAEDIPCDFMHNTIQSQYYWNDSFSAVSMPLENGGGTMWFILPDEGVSLKQLVEKSEATELILSGEKWKNQKEMMIHLSVPKFDITSQTDLKEGLQSLGVTDVFDASQSDFSPLCKSAKGVFIGSADHGVRVAVDEEGITAAAYTVMPAYGSTPPLGEEIYFTLDRPFLFAVTSDDGLPLFVGTVNNPIE